MCNGYVWKYVDFWKKYLKPDQKKIMFVYQSIDFEKCLIIQQLRELCLVVACLRIQSADQAYRRHKHSIMG